MQVLRLICLFCRYAMSIILVAFLSFVGSLVYEPVRGDAATAQLGLLGDQKVSFFLNFRQVFLLSGASVAFGLITHKTEYARYPLWKIRRAYYWAKRGYVRPRSIYAEF
jgi:hypothetical protein